MNTAEFKVLANELEKFDKLLVDAASYLGLDISDTQKKKLLLYLDKLLFWNKAYNLTAIKQPKEALIKHVFDCLTIIPHLQTGDLLDIGTGAGLPGVIVAICQPQRQVTVLDSNQKKIRFIKQSISELNIKNVNPIASRIENFVLAEEERFSVVTSRAFASLTDFIVAASPCLKIDGYLQAMKGLAPDDNELKTLENDWHIRTIKLDVPQLQENRHLINLQHLETRV